jgi:predicted homoserine dehydrogenase-like protein
MNLGKLMRQRADSGNPVRVGLIGAGKFGSMFLAQARLTTGLQVMAIADLDITRAKDACLFTGWEEERVGAQDFADAYQNGSTYLTDDSATMIVADGIEVVIDATGDPAVGIRHALLAIEHGRHIIMVNVEADVLAGPLLAQKAEQAGVVYSLAWGDQPALIAEHVDWARTCGFEVVCAGKGTRYLPRFHQSTPDTVWDNFHIDAETAARGRMNPKMFNSFIDGTKSGIEMTAVCNATGLIAQPDGLAFPPASRFQLSDICKPVADGGTISHAGTTEVVSSLNRDGTEIPHNLMLGTYVVVKADNEYVRNCFEEYILLPDESYEYSTLYRPIHYIGLELGVSVASAALRQEATGSAICFNSDVVATAKKPMKAGEMLDGEGGYCVWGKQMPSAKSLALGGLPIGLAQNITLKNDIAEGTQLTWDDVTIDESDHAYQFRREMEATFANKMPE